MSIFDRLSAPRCIHRQDMKHHPNCFNEDGTPKDRSDYKPKYPKVLSLDVETLPILGYSWGVWNQNIYPDQVKKDWCLLSYSAKWLGSSGIISNVLSSRQAVRRDDSDLVNELWRLLESADVVIGHNSKRFDIKKINTRFWKHGLHKPSPYKHIDTLSSAKSVFGLTYNKLDFIAEFIGIQKKLETDFGLWESCDEGDKAALQQMREYNERDAQIQEQVYLHMREWIPNHPNFAVYANLTDVCPICLGCNYKEIEPFTANRYQYKQYRCSCGSIWHDTYHERESK